MDFLLNFCGVPDHVDFLLNCCGVTDPVDFLLNFMCSLSCGRSIEFVWCY